MSIEEIKQKALPILKKYGVTKAGVFGSFARNQAKEDSDLDILVEINSDLSLLGFVALKQELEDALGRKIDLVEYETVKPAIREHIMSEQVVLL